MKKVRLISLFLILLMGISLQGCMQLERNASESEHFGVGGTADNVTLQIPYKLKGMEGEPPRLKVYDTSIEEVSEMDIETYIMGVVAGEMKNDWPIEALKAQAILARTFVLKFCQDKDSKYKGADISTDIEEAQAYSYENINDRIKQAVEETRGLVMNAEGELPHAWFHAHSGGMTELPSVALDFKGADPYYLQPKKSMESDDAPENVKSWKAVFSEQEVVDACKASGLKVNDIKSIKIGEIGESGRAATLLINGESISAPTFRIKIGANKMKSTLLDSIEEIDDEIIFSGRGFGHGVGMSQWGAFAMAKEGKTAEEIVEYYFQNVEITKLW